MKKVPRHCPKAEQIWEDGDFNRREDINYEASYDYFCGNLGKDILDEKAKIGKVCDLPICDGSKLTPEKKREVEDIVESLKKLPDKIRREEFLEYIKKKNSRLDLNLNEKEYLNFLLHLHDRKLTFKDLK